ncbi:hypothetical protein D3C77_659550 [compost metagenome]
MEKKRAQKIDSFVYLHSSSTLSSQHDHLQLGSPDFEGRNFQIDDLAGIAILQRTGGGVQKNSNAAV